MKLLKLFIASLILISVGCNRDRADTSPRTEVPDLNNGGNETLQVPALPFSLQGLNSNACSRVEDLRANLRPMDPAVSFVSEIGFKNGIPQGGLDLAFAPFVQLFFGETFIVDTPEDFLLKVEAEYKLGHVSFIEYTMIQAIKWNKTLLRAAQMTATNKKLEENFPGIFGAIKPMDKALHMLLVQKTIPMAGFDPAQHPSILTAKLPLYDLSWNNFPEDVRNSLTAAAASLNASIDTADGKRERLCGLVLWQRAFAQLLSLKGYAQPELLDNDVANSITKKLQKLDSKHEGFATVAHTGALFNPQTQSTVALSATDIANYNPALKSLQVAAQLPTGTVQKQAGTLTDTLHLMESLVYFFAGTSPASPWIKGAGDYILVKDITDPTNKGILPLDANNLALGLLKLNLSNLAKYNIVQINAKGQQLKPGEAAAGILPMESATAGVDLENVAALTRFAIYLDQTLDQFKTAKPAVWAKMNPLYTEKVLAQLMGKEMFSQKELDTLLNPDEQKQILKSTLAQMRFPLANLLLQMGLGTQCVSHLAWDLKTGVQKPTALCSSDLKLESKLALRSLAMHIRSPLLYKKTL